MSNTLENYLRGTYKGVEQVMIELDRMECRVSTFYGPQFYIPELDSGVNFDQIVHIVFKRTEDSLIDGESYVRRLNQLYVKGEEVLKKSPLAYLIDIIKRFILYFFSTKNQELEAIGSKKLPPNYRPPSPSPVLRMPSYWEDDDYGYSLKKAKGDEVKKYIEEHIDLIVQELIPFGFKEPMGHISVERTNLRIRSPDETPQLRTKHFVETKRNDDPYDEFQTENLYLLPLTSTPKEYLEQHLKNLKQTLPLWLELRKALKELWDEDFFRKTLMESTVWTNHQERIEALDFKIHSIETSSPYFYFKDTQPVLSLSWTVKYSKAGIVERMLNTTVEKEGYLEFRLGDLEIFRKIWRDTTKKQSFEKEFLFYLGYIQAEEYLSWGEPKQEEQIVIENELKTIETLMEFETGTLSQLAKDQEYEAINQKLKEAKKKGGLKFHTDKENGDKGHFQELFSAIGKAQKWCDEKLVNSSKFSNALESMKKDALKSKDKTSK